MSVGEMWIDTIMDDSDYSVVDYQYHQLQISTASATGGGADDLIMIYLVRGLGSSKVFCLGWFGVSKSSTNSD
ncbi:hypothetical protein RND71_028559 [Anisodus tanguticus]|uniref:Uncharacterized protein n=1 Tax=Anisodus tanguticus TaxID=243964 RepID=A0AAE1RJZ3_9SOLA|nr:hypothetical protein RND71_028559 [Anisodus tanguticus]